MNNTDNVQHRATSSTRDVEDRQAILNEWMKKQRELYRYYESLQHASEGNATNRERAGDRSGASSVPVQSIPNHGSQDDCAPTNDERDPIDYDDLSEESDDDDCPHDFVCPISQRMMIDPVITVYGTTYERKFIEEWLQHHDTDPLTNDKLPSKMLIPNRNLQSVIQEWVMKKS
jgi:hypothetical protein